MPLAVVHRPPVTRGAAYLFEVAGLTVDDLLAGPRGRVLCMAVAHRLDQRVWSAWLHATWHPAAASRLADLVRALEAIDPEPVHAWRDSMAFLEPVDETVSHAMYWQPPHDQDVIASDPAVVVALRPIAGAIATAPATVWWSSPVDLEALRYTSRFDDERPLPPTLAGASERLGRWRGRTLEDDRDAAMHRPTDPAAPFSGNWWSTPAMASLLTTTRPLSSLGSIELAWQEDSFGQRNASIWPLSTTRAPRVWEIDRPAAWVRLVEQYPLDVTNARRHDWYKTTGRAGTWLIPDWSAVAADWDAVHVSVAGYLTTATRALPVADGTAATMLAGWNPDQTWWLTDILATTTPHPAESWHNPEDPDGSDFGCRLASPRLASP